MVSFRLWKSKWSWTALKYSIFFLPNVPTERSRRQQGKKKQTPQIPTKGFYKAEQY